jgi:cell division protein FtsA
LASNVPEELSSPQYATCIGLVIKGLQGIERSKPQGTTSNKVKGSNDVKKGSFFDNVFKKGRQFFDEDIN